MSNRPVLPVSDFHVKEAEKEVITRLYNAIPLVELLNLRALLPGVIINGGFVRLNCDMANVVASYNNTRASESQIVEWFERALLGIEVN